MATVLRGHSIQSFRTHLLKNGTLHPFVYANPVATASWTEASRKSDGPDFDNEPLMWIYAMTRPQASDRPHANKGLELILDSSAGERFCRSFCSSSYFEAVWDALNTRITRTNFEEDKTEDEYLLAQLLASSNQQFKNGLHQSPSRNLSVEAWLSSEYSAESYESDITGDNERGNNRRLLELSEDELSQLDSKPIPEVSQRLRNLDIFQQAQPYLDKLETANNSEDHSLMYEVTADEAYSLISEDTVRLDRSDEITLQNTHDKNGSQFANSKLICSLEAALLPDRIFN